MSKIKVFLKKIWQWLGNDVNYRVLTIIIALTALYLGHTIQIKIDSIEQNIKNLYQHYSLETFCYNELKDSYRTENGKNVVDIKLKYNPVPNSISVWEGALNVSPAYFKVEGNNIILETNSNAEGLKQICNNSDFRFSVSYVKDLEY